MNIFVRQRLQYAGQVRNAFEYERQSYRIRVIKIVCGLLLGVCFWYSVPYALPLKLDLDPKKAAAQEATAYEGSSSRQLAMPVIALVSLYLLWRLPKRRAHWGRLAPIAAMYVCWSLLGFAWSDDPSLSAKRLVVFLINCLIAYTIARRFNAREMALWGFTQTACVALISLYSDLHERVFAPLDADYRFCGVMAANYQAMNLVVCLVCGLSLLQARPRWLPWLGPSIATILVLLYLTRARVGAFMGLAILIIMVGRIAKARLLFETRTMGVLALLSIVVSISVYVVAKNGQAAAVGIFMMGRSDTESTSSLSNRAPLWGELWESAEKRPWTGYSYQAFWSPARVEMISADQGWMVPHAHNTYLDQILSLGVAGALMYSSLVLGAAGVSWRRFYRNAKDSLIFYAVLLSWLALTSFSESIPLDPYLPSILAYVCVIKMCLVDSSKEVETDGPFNSSIVRGLPLFSAEGTQD